MRKETVPMILGSAFHEGMKEYLVNDYDMTGAVNAARSVLNQAIRDRKGNADEQDMVKELNYSLNKVRDLLRYYLPKMGWGDTIDVVWYDYETESYFTNSSKPREDRINAIPMVEFAFDYPLDEFVTVTGIVDAVYYDYYTEQYVLADWKLRSRMQGDTAAALDGQLHLYAACINALTDIPFNTVEMYQFNSRLPSDAKINNNGTLSKSAQITTFSHWYDTLPDALRREVDRNTNTWQAWADVKLKPGNHFMNATRSLVTDVSHATALDNVRSIYMALSHAQAMLDNDIALPAVLSSYGCAYCPFAKLCGNQIRHKQLGDEILNTYLTD